MVKDKKGAFDGWYWSYHAPNYTPEQPGIDYPDSGFGLYCLRCHASAEKESTFITTKNVEGDPISFNVLVATMKPLQQAPVGEAEQVGTTNTNQKGPFPPPRAIAHPNFLKLIRECLTFRSSKSEGFPARAWTVFHPRPAGRKALLLRANV
jgi:hypothetical protein